MFLIDWRWTQLQELSLEGLNLTAVPSQVWESGEITKVNLSKNSIEELPTQLSSSVSLQVVFHKHTFYIQNLLWLLKISYYLCICRLWFCQGTRLKTGPVKSWSYFPVLCAWSWITISWSRLVMLVEKRFKELTIASTLEDANPSPYFFHLLVRFHWMGFKQSLGFRFST